MKGYFLFAPVEPQNVGPDSGVERKVRAQHKSLNSYLDCELVILPPAVYTGSMAEKMIRRLPFTAAWRKWHYDGEFDGADFLYIRQVYHDESFVRYLRAIRRRNPQIKIIYEIPTFPYDAETHISLSNASFAAKERIARRKVARLVDRFVTFYGQESIWGTPCIDLLNGYDFSQVSIPERTLTDTLHILSVSLTGPWHGYDRLIEGIHQYYEDGGSEKIIYHLVGTILLEHAEMIKRYHLEEKVILHGYMSGEPLKELYRQCLIGVDILAGFRRQSQISSTLKSREYAAYGLPILTGCPIDYLPENYPYQLLVPADDTPVDIERLLVFYHGVYDDKNPAEIAETIRSYAERRCDMSITMKPVADWLNKAISVEHK